MAIYEKNYNVKKIIELLKKQDKKTLNIEEIILLVGFDLIDLNNFYVNHIRNRVRYKKEERR